MKFSTVLLGLCLSSGPIVAAEPGEVRQFSGIYPQIAFFNNEAECGTGAVVPWAGRLWAITYGPHLPFGSSDKLYEIDDALRVTIRPESVGGTHANRMIHRESNQLIIGPYLIDSARHVRVIAPTNMPGRLTGNGRHLTDPANKVYFATMEEGFYEVDLRTLAVKELYPDGNRVKNIAGDLLPGYHGKGAFSGQGRLIYANNGERSSAALTQPEMASGCLAEWDGTRWSVVRRNQFTEVAGPGGLAGNAQPATDPVWSVGWDYRSLILLLREAGQWHAFRLPKASHTYDGAHGWNTEWPRIREIGERDLLMTMHGMFWRFPKTFSVANTAGIAPRSSYLKVIGDFCRWNDQVVFGCDDTAKNEFLNKRKAKGAIAGPGQSQSNLWFVPPDRLDELGPALARGAVWLNDRVRANTPSDPFLFGGFARRAAHLAHDSNEAVTFTFEIDADGHGQWHTLREISVPAKGYAWIDFTPAGGQWIRTRTDRDCNRATVMFTQSNPDRRAPQPDPIFSSLPSSDAQSYSGGLIRARGENLRTLHFAAATVRDGALRHEGYYEIGAELKLRRVNDAQAHAWLKKNVAVPAGVLAVDDASVIYTDDNGRRFRLPKGDGVFDFESVVPRRVCREVCTERDLFNAHGTFYELPAENAGGFAKIRPIATHNRLITDYCSWRGLLVLSGIALDLGDDPHLLRADDGQCALWFGVVDDLWRFGKPSGHGGPWKNTEARAGQPSDPYLMTGYDRKALTLSHDAPARVTMRVEVDITGTGDWHLYRSFEVPPDQPLRYEWPAAFQAYWVRVTAGQECRATAWLDYD